MSNSSLVTYKHICSHYDKGRQGKKIEKIFVHHMAGNLTVKQCGNVFDNRPASAHYGVNGNAIGLYVNESDTAWHCGNWNYNTRSIGIELANDGGSNWHVSDTTIKTAIKLIVDICRRNGIKKLIYTGDMKGNLCMHKWVCSTSCPGPYLSTRFTYIASQVNKMLGNGESVSPDFPSPFGKLEEDGIGGPDTVGSTQRFLGTTIDFVISGQNEDYREYYEAFRDDVIEYDDNTSTMVLHLQWLIGVYEDGELGPVTAKAVQKLVGVEQDGYWGPITMKAWQHYLNTHEKAVYPSTHASKPVEKKATTTKKAATTATVNTTATKAVAPVVASTKQGYTGKLPELRVKRTAAEVISNVVKWAKWIAGDNDFHYGSGNDAHHNGCYFCGTQPSSKKNSGIKEWKKTYCCNPFVHACWAHGGLVPAMLKMCQKGKSYGFKKGEGYDVSNLFKKISRKNAKAGDVFCSGYHVALYIGDGKIIHAAHEDDNKKNSSKWNSSISKGEWNDKYYDPPRVYRFIGKVDADIVITHGEYSSRVGDMQRFLIWYGTLAKGEDDNEFGDKTLKALKKFQEKEGLKVSGKCDAKTIAKMKAVRK